jgi:hypothetical protein
VGLYILEPVKDQQTHGLEALAGESEKLWGVFVWHAISATMHLKKFDWPVIGCSVVWAVVLVEGKELKVVGGDSC